MKQSYPAVPVLTRFQAPHLTEPHSDSSPWLLSIRGIEHHGDIRPSNQEPLGFLNFLSRPESGLAVSVCDVINGPARREPMISRAESLLRALSSHEPLHPAGVVGAVNRALCGINESDSYLTLFHAWVDPVRRELRYVNAGHEPAILFRHRRNRIAFLEHTGAVLGLTTRIPYGQRSMPLDTGDVLVVFTSGIAETANIHGSLFGSKAIVDVLRRTADCSAATIASLVLDEAERHAGWAVRSADHGIAVVRFLGERQRPAFHEEAAEEPDGELAMAAA